MIQRVLVLGGGSAGFLAALTLKARMPDLDVTVLHSKELGVIGVGEATTVALPKHVHGYLDIDPADFYKGAQPAWKLGIRFLWGPRPFFDYTFSYQLDWKFDGMSKNNGFYCVDDFTYADTSSALMSHNKAFVRLPNGDPLVGRDCGYHLENVTFVAYLEAKAQERGIPIIDDKVAEVLQDEKGITGLRLVSGTVLNADLYLDCSGFRSLLLGQALQEPYISFKTTLFNDRAVTGGWVREPGDVIQPYTTAETMDSGWCWRIDHLDRVNRGYVYASDFISDEEAQREFLSKNPRIKNPWFVKFKSGRYQNAWVKNVVAIGNSSGFVEPLESTSLAVVCDESRLLAECLIDGDRAPGPELIASYNHIGARAWDTIRYFLGIHFKFNTRLNTPYWRACRELADIGTAQPIVDYYQENGPSTYGRTALLRINDIFGMEGYLCLLFGQAVPFRKKWQPSPHERQLWNGIRAGHRAKALTALNSQDSFQAVTSPEWRWAAGFYRG